MIPIILSIYLFCGLAFATFTHIMMERITHRARPGDPDYEAMRTITTSVSHFRYLGMLTLLWPNQAIRLGIKLLRRHFSGRDWGVPVQVHESRQAFHQ
jgi:hypothetical protein